MKMRLFVAVEIDEAVRALALRAAQALAESGVVGRFEAPEKLHVTVAFLGAIEQPDLPAVIAALRESSDSCRPFALDFARLGAFPNERRPRVMWLGLMSASREFAACARRVREGFERLGYTFDHEATAHVTLCRPKFVPPKFVPSNVGIAPAEAATMRVNGLTLFQSLPAGQTTRYEALERTRFPA